jgi:uncharacterized DUF497 family protein
MRIPGIEFTEKFDDQNESVHNIGQAEVIDAVFFEEAIHISGEYRERGSKRRSILGCTNGLYITIIVDSSAAPWKVLSARPSDAAERKRFNRHAIANPNQLDEKRIETNEEQS